MGAGTVVLGACTAPPDLAAVQNVRQQPIQRFDSFQAVAVNGAHWVAGGGGVLVHSADGGQQWQRQELPQPASVVALAACPDGHFAALDFHGRVWSAQTPVKGWIARPFDTEFDPIAISCDPRNHLWVVGSYSTVLVSDDQGQNWSSEPPGDDAILTAIHWLDADHGVIAGEFGTLLITDDGGQHWQSREGALPEEFYPYSVLFSSPEQGWISGVAGTVLVTEDGGETWQEQANRTSASTYLLLQLGEHTLGISGGDVLGFDGDAWAPLAGLPRFAAQLTSGAVLDERALLVAGLGGTLQVVSLTTQLAQAGLSIVSVQEGQP